MTASAPGAVRIMAPGNPCAVDMFSITARYPLVTVLSVSRSDGRICPLMIPINIGRDTVIPLPRLAPMYGLPTSYELRATLVSPQGQAVDRAVGAITLDATADTTRFMAGLATLGPDSAGCVVLIGGGFGIEHQYAVINPPSTLGGSTLVVTAGAHVVPTPTPPLPGCGTRRVVRLDFLEVALIP